MDALRRKINQWQLQGIGSIAAGPCHPRSEISAGWTVELLARSVRTAIYLKQASVMTRPHLLRAEATYQTIITVDNIEAVSLIIQFLCARLKRVF